MESNCNTISVLHTTLICIVLLFSTGLIIDNKKYMHKILQSMQKNVNLNLYNTNKHTNNLYSCDSTEYNHYDQDQNTDSNNNIQDCYVSDECISECEGKGEGKGENVTTLITRDSSSDDWFIAE